MAHQVEEGGWPLGLQPLNMRSVSFSTFIITGSPSSLSHSSSDLDTESTGSFFHDRSITLGNLMGVSSIVELSRRRGKRVSESVLLGNNTRSNPKFKPWCFGLCLCQRDNDDIIDTSNNNSIIPLGHFLEVERTAQDTRQDQHSSLIYGADELTSAQPFGESSNSLFVDGQIVPPTISTEWQPDSDTNGNGRRHGRGFITPCF